MSTNAPISVAPSGTFRIGGDLEVHRLGYGAMQITGPGIFGPPADRAQSIAVLRRAVELGTDLIDTADSYGPHVSEELIAEALHPYPAGLVIATKAGLERPGPNKWVPNGRPEHLRAACEGSLRRLKLERIDLYQLHRIDDKVPAADQFGTFAELQREGKIRHIGLSEVTVAQIEEARRTLEIVTVQNRYNLVDRQSEDVLDYCTREGIGFIPWFPLRTGELTTPRPAVEQVVRKIVGRPVPESEQQRALARTAARLGAAPSQIALAWLLQRSPVMLPIPGTSKVKHLEENVAAAGLKLTREEFEALDREMAGKND